MTINDGNPGGAKAPRKPRITFKKQPIYDGLMRIAPSYYVNYGKKHIATIQSMLHDPADYAKCWMWYSGSDDIHDDVINTTHDPKSLEDCKAEIKKFFQDKL